MERRLITVPFGPLQSNMYLITGDAGIFVVDPSVSPQRTEEFSGISGLANGGAEVRAVLLTHGHHDHIKYVSEWQEAYPGAEFFFSSNDSELIGNGYMNCSYMEGQQIKYDFRYTDIAGMNGDSVFSDKVITVKVL